MYIVKKNGCTCNNPRVIVFQWNNNNKKNETRKISHFILYPKAQNIDDEDDDDAGINYKEYIKDDDYSIWQKGTYYRINVTHEMYVSFFLRIKN